jgi:hypothetical protein
MYKKVLSRPIGLWSEERKKKKRKTFKEDNISFPKKVPKCSVDANYKEGPRTVERHACTLAMRKG